MSRLGVVIAIVLISLFGTVKCVEITEEMKELMAMLHKTCVEETGVTEDLITSAMGGVFSEENALKCYMRCILVQGATMDDDGVIDVEALIAMMPDGAGDDVPAVMRKCGTQTGSDHCDTAFRTNKCWQENLPDKYMLI